MSTPDNASVLSSVLQANWQLNSPASSQISWATTRVDSATFLNAKQIYAIGVYNPSSPTIITPLSREVWQELERLHIDILVKVTQGLTVATATQTREAIKNEVYRIFHLQELKISGIQDVYPERELNKVEGQDLVRITVQVACLNFHIQT